MRLGVTEIRKINYALKSKFEFDFGDYSFYFFKRRLEEYCAQNSFIDLDDFLHHIYNCEQIEDNLTEYLNISENEFFRDPTLWEYIRDNILPKLANDDNQTVWFPEVSTGEELFSFLIVLYENNILEKVNIVVSTSSKILLKRLKAGIVNSKGFENNDINYKRFNGKQDFGAYFDYIDNKIFLKKMFFQNVKFKHHSVRDAVQINGVKFVLFRNKCIYFSGLMQNKALKNVCNNIIPGGILIVGAKENIRNNLLDLNLEEINRFEKVYKKVSR